MHVIRVPALLILLLQPPLLISQNTPKSAARTRIPSGVLRVDNGRAQADTRRQYRARRRARYHARQWYRAACRTIPGVSTGINTQILVEPYPFSVPGCA
eukprot:2569130-Rhodomonas_salina.2